MCGYCCKYYAPGSPPLARERRKEGRQAPALVGITPARAGKTSPNSQFFLRDQDHPRSRGKDAAQAKMEREVEGSPPLARERPLYPAPAIAVAGITPARAGKTGSFGSSSWPAGDHPRSRGKDSQAHAAASGHSGSPPLARERRFDVAFRHDVRGITPARAGKTARRIRRLCVDGDHPRSRGKDSLQLFS